MLCPLSGKTRSQRPVFKINNFLVSFISRRMGRREPQPERLRLQLALDLPGVHEWLVGGGAFAVTLGQLR